MAQKTFNEDNALKVNYRIGIFKVPVYIVPVNCSNAEWQALLRVAKGDRQRETRPI